MATPPATRQRPAHDRDGRAAVVERLAQHQRAPAGARAHGARRRPPRPCVDLVADVAGAREAGVHEPLGRGRARLAALGIGVGQLDPVRVEERDAVRPCGAPARATTASWRVDPGRRSRRGRRASPRSAVRASSRMSFRRSVARRCSSGRHERHDRGDERHARSWPGAQGRTAPASRACATASPSDPQPVARAANGDDRARGRRRPAASLSRRKWTWTSMARGSRNSCPPKIASSSSWRESSRPPARSSA